MRSTPQVPSEGFRRGEHMRWISKSLKSLVFLTLVAITPGQPAAARRAAEPPQDRNAIVDPAMFSGLSFRHLSVFNRGGRVTAVAGVPKDQKLYYMGSTGG